MSKGTMGLTPVLQVIEATDATPAAGSNVARRFKVVLSDGVHSVSALASKEAAVLIANQDVRVNTIVRVHEYSVSGCTRRHRQAAEARNPASPRLRGLGREAPARGRGRRRAPARGPPRRGPAASLARALRGRPLCPPRKPPLTHSVPPLLLRLPSARAARR